MPKMRNWALAAVAALASVAWAAETPVPYLLPGERVTGAITGSGDKKLVAFAGVEGSKLSVRVAAVKGSRLVPRLELIDPDGVLLDVGDTNPKSGGAAAMKGIVLGATGVWRIGLASGGPTGGAFELSASATVPSRARWTGTISAAGAPDDHVVDAAPGGSISIAVAAKGKAPANPAIDVVAPSGTVVGSVTGAKGRARLDDVPLTELGSYTVRVRGETGAFAASAKIRAAAKRKPVFADVASAPDIRSISPASAPDGIPVTFVLSGVGFGPRQTALLSSGATTLATSPVVTDENTEGIAVLDLAGVPPGSYTLRVATADGRSSTAPSPLVVTNRAPSVGVVDPPEAWGRYPFEADVRGIGFDTGATVKLRVSATGEEVPVEIVGETTRDRMRVRVSPVLRTTGPCDVEVTDPDGRANTLRGGLDLLGARIAPVAVRQRQTIGTTEMSVQSAAYDEVSGRVLIAVRDTRQLASFTLCDAATLAIVDTLEIPTSGLDQIDVAWDPVGRTYALLLNAWDSPGVARVLIVRDDDIHHGVSDTTVAMITASGHQVFGAAVAAARDVGGYLAVWQQPSETGGWDIRATSFSAAGVVDPSPARVVAHSDVVFQPDVAWRSPGRFVVAYTGSADPPVYGGIWAAVLDDGGFVVTMPALVAASAAWSIAGDAKIAQAPANGPTLIMFTYDTSFQYDVYDYHPACVRLAPGTLVANPTVSLDAEFGLSGGLSFNATWDPARAEFVAACVLDDGGVLLRRIAANGTPREPKVPERFFGYWPVLYAGLAPGSLGLAVGDSHDVDATANPPVYLLEADAMPLR